MVDCCYLDTIPPPPQNPISSLNPVSCGVSHIVWEASVAGILNSTVGETMGGMCRRLCAFAWREDGWRGGGVVIVKQKESSGGVTVPGRTQDNRELNGVLNGKSSVFSHRFYVIAALTLLLPALAPPPLSFYFFLSN